MHVRVARIQQLATVGLGLVSCESYMVFRGKCVECLMAIKGRRHVATVGWFSNCFTRKIQSG